MGIPVLLPIPSLGLDILLHHTAEEAVTMWSPKTLFGMSLTAIMACHSASTAEQCQGKDSCADQTIGSVMLQMDTWASKMPRKTVKTMFGVPILMETFMEADPVESEWVMVMKEGDNTEAAIHRICEAATHCTGEDIALGHITLHCTWQELLELAAKNREDIESIEADGVDRAIPELPEEVDPSLLQAGNVKSWGLDRIDARNGLDNSYNPPAGGGEGVHVYVLDTGIRTTHTDFGGRAIPTLECLGNGAKVCNGDTKCARDANGHGTHCAGTVGGSKYGVAKKTILHGVKVLDNNGDGMWTWYTKALDWILQNGERPAIVSASIGGAGKTNFVKSAIERTINQGIAVVVAAGNENDNSCEYTPGYTPSAINVGATGQNDKRSWFSNYGQCIDIWAPGSKITSAGHRNDGDIKDDWGTSMACPHVSGAAALLLGKEPNLSPKTITERLISSATKDKVTNATGSPNKLLYIQGGSTPPQTTASPPAECKDLHRKCSTQAWKNRCHKTKFQKLCPFTCGKCDGGTPECKNKHPKCLTTWKNKCHRAKVQNQCPLMCGKCPA